MHEARCSLERHLGQVDSTLAHYTEAIGLYCQERANAYLALGDLERERNEFDLAKDLYLRARPLHIAERASIGLTQTRCSLVLVAHAQGDPRARDEYLAEAVAAAQRSNTPAVVAYVQAVRGEVGGAERE